MSCRPGAAALALALLLTTPASAAELVIAPFLQRATTSSIVVVWEQATPSAPEVRYGPTADYGMVATPEAVGTRHEVTLTGLDAGATYHWALFEDGQQITDDSTLMTAVAPGTPFSFLAFGDTRSNPDAHSEVIAAMALEPDARFYVQTGDLVADGEDYDQWLEYLTIEQPLMRRVPIYPLIGNHDEFDGQAAHYRELFVLPDDSPGPEEYYSFDYGNVHFVALDGHVNVELFGDCMEKYDVWLFEDCFSGEQVAWVEADVAAAAADPAIDHIIVTTHIGAYSSKDDRSGNGHVRRLLPTFHRFGMTLLISGHDHYYERGLDRFGIPYIISGGGGAPLYDLSTPSSAPHEVVTNASALHYLVVDVDGPTLTVTAKQPDGTVLDSFTTTRVDECLLDSDCADATPPPDCSLPATCSVARRCTFDCVIEGGNPFGASEPEPEPAPEPMPEPAAEPEPDAGPPAEDDAGKAGVAEPLQAEPEATPSGDGCGGCSGSPDQGALPVALALLAMLALAALRARRHFSQAFERSAGRRRQIRRGAELRRLQAC